jgi:hypothetical protein
MPDLVLPSKLVSEKIEVTFEFCDELEWGETILNWEAEVFVYTGDDPTPELVVFGKGELAVTETAVQHKFYRGLPGCIYTLICNVTGSEGGRYKKTCRLAVLPDEALNPPIYAEFYSSTLYPLEATESYQPGGITVLRGTLLWNQYEYYRSVGVQVLAGEMYGALDEHVQPPEDFYTGAVTILVGNIWGTYGEIEADPESYAPVRLYVTEGILWGAYIAYTHPPEDYYSTGLTVHSGTLS